MPGRAGLAVAALYGLGSITFITAVFNTSTANLVFILAFTTMFAALLSWIFLKERPRPATLHRHGRDDRRASSSSSATPSAPAICSATSWRCARPSSSPRRSPFRRASGKDMGFTALVGVVFPFARRRASWSRGPASRSKRRGGSSSTARSSCRCRSSAWPPARATSPGRKSRCSTCWKPFWRRSGCG